jgi:tyrosine-protein phosphatase SIW14
MKRTAGIVAVAIYTVALIGVPYWYAKEQRARSRNFRVVTPDVLYRCGQLSKGGIERIIFDYGIRTVISLRAHDGKEHPSRWEERYCAEEGVVFVRIPIRNHHDQDGAGAAFAEASVEFNRVLSNPVNYPRPILLHCFAGMHRTGALAAVYRMEFEHWSNDEALAEMEECGYTELEEDIGEFLWGYRRVGLTNGRNATLGTGKERLDRFLPTRHHLLRELSDFPGISPPQPAQ